MANTDDFPLTDPDYILTEQFDDGILRSASIGGNIFQRVIRPPRRLFKLTFNNRPSTDKASVLSWYREFEASWFVFTHPAYIFYGGPPLAAVPRVFPVQFAQAPSFDLMAYNCWNFDVQLVEAIGCALEAADYPDPSDGMPMATIPGTTVGADQVFIYAGYGFVYTGTGTLTIDGVATAATNLEIALGLHRVYVTAGTGTLEAVI